MVSDVELKELLEVSEVELRCVSYRTDAGFLGGFPFRFSVQYPRLRPYKARKVGGAVFFHSAPAAGTSRVPLPFQCSVT